MRFIQLQVIIIRDYNTYLTKFRNLSLFSPCYIIHTKYFNISSQVLKDANSTIESPIKLHI